MGFSDFFLGKSAQNTQAQNYTPQQQQALNQLLSSGLSGLNKTNLDFAPIEQNARNQFSQSTVPGLAERFTSMGSGGQRSSAFQGALGSAASGLESNLAALRSQYGLQQHGQLLNQINTGLTPQFENIFHPAEPGFLASSSKDASSTFIQMLIKMLMGGG